jgi:surface carbohydrate biosynthesis protein
MSIKALIILDNPQRDIFGVSSLSEELTRLGATVYVTGLLTAPIDFFSINPDVVFHTYVRKNNYLFLHKIHQTGSLNFVVESEGIVGKSIDDYFDFVNQNLDFEIIDGYFTWGHKQKDILIKHYPKFLNKIFCYGNPRFDEFRDAKDIIFDNKSVLINTNFPIVDPKFSKNNIDEIRKNSFVGHNKDKLEKIFLSSVKLRSDLCNTILRLSKDFAFVDFTLRPHPFEKSDFYVDFFSDHKNVTVKSDGTSIQALCKSNLLIQLNCTTAMEAHLLGIPVLMPDYLNHDNLRYLASELFSKKVFSYDELKQNIENFLHDKYIRNRNIHSDDFLFIGDLSSSYYIANIVFGFSLKRSKRFDKILNYWILRFFRYKLDFNYRNRIELKNYRKILEFDNFKIYRSITSSNSLFIFKK